MHHPTSPSPELPSLDAGVTLLDVDGDPKGVLHSLVVDHVLMDPGTALWVDTHGHAVTRPLVRVAPSDRILDRVRVARGFTAFQHYELVDRLATQITPETALLVLPAIDGRYRDDDLRGDEGETLFVRVLARIAGLARAHDIPVLVTRTAADAFTEPLERATDRTLTCRRTSQGPRFVGEAFETHVYPVGDGLVQTTLAFWADVLATREPLYDAATTATEVRVGGAN